MVSSIGSSGSYGLQAMQQNLFLCKKPRPLGVVRVQRLCRLNN
jgi:hypothetical protein